VERIEDPTIKPDNCQTITAKS